MGRKPTGRSPNRPRTPIDWDLVANMCAAGCHGPTIAAQIGVTDDTLYIRTKKDHGIDFTAYRLKHLMRGDDVLRSKQFELAQKGDVTMLKWLGKNRLGQRERIEHTGLPAAVPPVINVIVRPMSDGR